MSCPINEAELTKLKTFIAICKASPTILNLPQLEFFKKFIEHFGGVIPPGDFNATPPPPKPEQQQQQQPKTTSPPKSNDQNKESTTESSTEQTAAPTDPESEESDMEIDTEGCLEPDGDDPNHLMGDSTKEPTEEECDQASDIRSKAAKAYSEQKYDESVTSYTEAIMLNPTNSLFYAKRGQAYLKLNKPNACIKDCDRALELNCDSAAAYKFRGRANRLLGNWELAAKDLRQACKIDFDEEADEWLREVTPNAKKLEQHQIKQERRRAEKELRERQERVRKAQEANKKAAEEEAARAAAGGSGGGGGGGGAGGNPFGGAGGPGGIDFSELLGDPELMPALQDIMENPDNIRKYLNNPKIMKMMAAFGKMGGGGMPGMGGMGGMPGMGGFPGFGGAAPPPSSASAGDTAGGPPKPPPSADLHDDGLD